MVPLKPLPVGVDIFEDMITNGYYYVDKTLLIKDLIDNKGKAKMTDTYDKLRQICDKALEQIDEKEYVKELTILDYRNILKYGAGFFRKSCMIKKGG